MSIRVVGIGWRQRQVQGEQHHGGGRDVDDALQRIKDPIAAEPVTHHALVFSTSINRPTSNDIQPARMRMLACSVTVSIAATGVAAGLTSY